MARVGLFSGRIDESETDHEGGETDRDGRETVSDADGGAGDELGEADRNVEPCFELRAVVETALAEALMLAARAGRWEIVERIAAELSDRRRARADVRKVHAHPKLQRT